MVEVIKVNKQLNHLSETTRTSTLWLQRLLYWITRN